MTDLIRLAERVEALARPDREVDAAIGQATVGEGWRVDNDGSAFCWVDDPEYGEGWMPNGEVPHYTSSIDAAMSLVPPGIEKELTDIHGVGRATVGLNTDCMTFGEHKGGSLALALSAAALRSLAAQRGQG